MAGIVSYGSYIPYRRLKRSAIAAVLGVPATRGERAVASFDEDSISMAVEALAMESLLKICVCTDARRDGATPSGPAVRKREEVTALQPGKQEWRLREPGFRKSRPCVRSISICR